MAKLLIEGGQRLQGAIEAQGAKNAITKMMVASLLTKQVCTFQNVPNIDEVVLTAALCKELGSEIEWNRKQKTLSIQTKQIRNTHIHQKFSGANRIPILLMGALLGRTNEKLWIPTAGGCQIGKRPIDFHLNALRQLGAEINEELVDGERVLCTHAPNGLHGGCITLPFPSVGATENALLAAASAEGKTTIKNIAIEPEILDLIAFLQKLGVILFFKGDREIQIENNRLHDDIHHHVLADRIEVASYAIAAISTKGSVFVKGATHTPLMPFLPRLRQLGAGYRIYPEGIEFFYDKPLKGCSVIETGVHPCFLTDWQQPFVVLLTQSEGLSMVHETLYENRFGYTETLKSMGAHLELTTECLSSPCRFEHLNAPHSLLIHGKTPLKAMDIEIPDLRAGFAYIVAALVAKGESSITNLHYLDRGYEDVDAKLQSIGAKVKRVNDTTDESKTLSTSKLEKVLAHAKASSSFH